MNYPTNWSGVASSPGGYDFASADYQRTVNKRTRPTTLVACTECRKARAKCDGIDPSACSRCKGRGSACSYEPHTKVQKHELIKELQAARAREEDITSKNIQFSMVFDILAKHENTEGIVERLQRGDSLSAITEWLKTRAEYAPYFAVGKTPIEDSSKSRTHSIGVSSQHSMSVNNLLN